VFADFPCMAFQPARRNGIAIRSPDHSVIGTATLRHRQSRCTCWQTISCIFAGTPQAAVIPAWTGLDAQTSGRLPVRINGLVGELISSL